LVAVVVLVLHQTLRQFLLLAVVMVAQVSLVGLVEVVQVALETLVKQTQDLEVAAQVVDSLYLRDQAAVAAAHRVEL
jgi:hypothetical protein